MSMSASVLKRSIRPRRRSLTRGWDTRKTFAASLCLRRRDAMSFWTWIIRSARTRRCSASPRRNPRSRNTLPVDGVTLTFMVHLPPRQIACTPLPYQGPESLSAELQFPFRSSPRPLLEPVEHVDGLHELGDVQDAMLQSGMNPDLPDARPDTGDRFPIKRVQSLLDTPELEPCQSPGISRKCPHVTPRRAEPLDRLVGHTPVCKYSYILSSPQWPSCMTRG